MEILFIILYFLVGIIIAIIIQPDDVHLIDTVMLTVSWLFIAFLFICMKILWTIKGDDYYVN